MDKDPAELDEAEFRILYGYDFADTENSVLCQLKRRYLVEALKRAPLAGVGGLLYGVAVVGMPVVGLGTLWYLPTTWLRSHTEMWIAVGLPWIWIAGLAYFFARRGGSEKLDETMDALLRPYRTLKGLVREYRRVRLELRWRSNHGRD